MASENAKAHWTEADESMLLDFLSTLDATSGDGKNFKAFVWTAASGKLNPLVTKGGPKLAKSCKNKWQSVRACPFYRFSAANTLRQLKKTYAVVKAIQAVSGWTWSGITGASIDESTSGSWEAYVAKYKDAKPFRNAGWIHLPKVSLLLPATARGTNIFRPSDASTGLGSSRTMTPQDEYVPDAPTAPRDRDSADAEAAQEKSDSEYERTPVGKLHLYTILVIYACTGTSGAIFFIKAPYARNSHPSFRKEGKGFGACASRDPCSLRNQLR
jgi:hypothetical protein